MKYIKWIVKTLNLLYFVLPLYILFVILMFSIQDAGLFTVEKSLPDAVTAVFAFLALALRFAAIYTTLRDRPRKIYAQWLVFLIDIALITIMLVTPYGEFSYESGLGSYLYYLIVFPYDIFGNSLYIFPGPLVMMVLNAIFELIKNPGDISIKKKL